MSKPVIKVMIVEDDELIAKRYKMILSKDTEIQLIGWASSGYEGTMMAALYKPDVILMDIELEDKQAGLRATTQILNFLPDTKVVVLTVSETDDTIYRAFEIGVTNYLLKNMPPETIIESIKSAYHGQPSLHSNIAGRITREFQRIKKKEDMLLKKFNVFTKITQSELEVLELIMKNYSRQEICEMRFIEHSTLKSQVHSILKKFNKKNMEEVKKLLNDLDFMDMISYDNELK